MAHPLFGFAAVPTLIVDAGQKRPRLERWVDRFARGGQVIKEFCLKKHAFQRLGHGEPPQVKNQGAYDGRAGNICFSPIRTHVHGLRKTGRVNRGVDDPV
jgi:hypothetical protein